MLLVLVVDRRHADALVAQAALTRGLVTVGGWLLVIGTAWVWRASMRLTESQGRARALQAEAVCLRDFSQAAAGLAHEIRNPLGLIRGWMQRLSEPDLEPDTRQAQMQAVVEECDRVTARMNQFLAFARPSRPLLETVDPVPAIAQLATILEPDLSEKQIALRAPSAAPSLRADPEMFRQILFNLLQNAIQFSPRGGTVEVRLTPAPNGRVRCAVCDQGPGVRSETVARLFTPYFTTRPHGTGLGLAIVRQLATAQGWEVGYQARTAGGAEFWFEAQHA